MAPTPCIDRILAESYRHCVSVARTQARNFYFSFVTLPSDRRRAMCVVYAFMRHCDDLTDEAAIPEERAARLAEWRGALDRALSGDYGGDPILPALHDTIRRYEIPQTYLYDMIDGMEMDLTVTRYETFDALRAYCYRVASVVGLVCLRIWGYAPDREQEALAGAEACGIAFQLINILRDVKEDAQRGRIYLPLEDLRRFGVTEEEIGRGEPTDRLRELIRFEAGRADDFYRQAIAAMPFVDRSSRVTLRIMLRIYHGILGKIERQGFDVFTRRARVGNMAKCGIVVGEWLAGRFPRGEPAGGASARDGRNPDGPRN
jgi:phytoene synthase